MLPDSYYFFSDAGNFLVLQFVYSNLTLCIHVVTFALKQGLSTSRLQQEELREQC